MLCIGWALLILLIIKKIIIDINLIFFIFKFTTSHKRKMASALTVRLVNYDINDEVLY